MAVGAERVKEKQTITEIEGIVCFEEFKRCLVNKRVCCWGDGNVWVQGTTHD